MRAQKEMGRSSYGAIFVGRYATGDDLAGQTKWNRAYGVDANIQVSRTPARVGCSSARTDTPGTTGSDYAGRAFYNFTNNLWQVSGGFRRSATASIPRSASCRAAATAVRSSASSTSRSRRTSRGFAASRRTRRDNVFSGSTASCRRRCMHIHPFEIQPTHGGRFGWFFDRNKDNPTTPFVVYNRDGSQVVDSAGRLHVVAERRSNTCTTPARP